MSFLGTNNQMDFEATFNGMGSLSLNDAQNIIYNFADTQASWYEKPILLASRGSLNDIVSALYSSGYVLDSSTPNSSDTSSVVNAALASGAVPDALRGKLPEYLTQLRSQGYAFIRLQNQSTSINSPQSGSGVWSSIISRINSPATQTPFIPQSTPRVQYAVRQPRGVQSKNNNMMWIVGIGIFVFAIAFGVVAAKNNE